MNKSQAADIGRRDGGREGCDEREKREGRGWEGWDGKDKGRGRHSRATELRSADISRRAVVDTNHTRKKLY